MIGLEFDVPIAPLRKKLIEEHKVFTGTSSNKNVLRLLPPLSFSKSQADQFLDKLDRALKS
jgi:acetylornithine aminotransferase